MIKSHKRKDIHRCVVGFGTLAVIFTLIPAVYAFQAEPAVTALFQTAAFSQCNSGTTPSRVVTTALHIFSLDASAKKITVWNKTVTGNQLVQFSGIDAQNNGYVFAAPYGFAKHPTQNIIAVTDKGTAAQRISLYSYTETAGSVVFTFMGSCTNSMIVNPSDVAFFSDGSLAVSGNLSSGLNPYLLKLSGSYSSLEVSGGYLYSGSTGTFDGIDVDQTTDHILVASASAHCVYEFDSTGSIQKTYGVSGTSGSGSGYLSRPSDVDVWSAGTMSKKLIVSDQFNNRVSIFHMDATGGAFMTFGGLGTEPGQMSKPYSIFGQDGTNQITVADTVNRRLQLFSLDTTGVDSDGDGMPDSWEITHGLNPDDETDAALDPDGDGLTNFQEYTLGTDPQKKDTDGDGLNDGYEHNTLGSDPLDPNSPGAAAVIVSGSATYAENSVVTQSLSVLLGSTPTSNIVFAVTGYIPGFVEGVSTVTVPAGTNATTLRFVAVNGPTNCTLHLNRTPAGFFLAGSHTFSVSNVAPTIVSATASAYAVTQHGTLVLTGAATDPSPDLLTYRWTFDDGSSAITGSTATNTFSVLGTVAVTLTVTDQDGGSTSTHFNVSVEASQNVDIVFTAIDTNSVTFRIPDTAKDQSFTVETTPALSGADLNWTDWVVIEDYNISNGGDFTEPLSGDPGTSIDVNATDDGQGYTLVTFDIWPLYNTSSNQFFQVRLGGAY